MTLAEAALWYAERGIPVFPCRVRGKEPLTQHGFHDATTDLEQVRAWWREHPQANIGVDLERSRLLLIDADPRNGGPEDRADLAAALGGLPDNAPEVVTGGGGRHIYLRCDDPLPYAATAPGIEIKARGYAVLPPSVHPITKRRYTWDGADPESALLDPPTVPEGLLRRLLAAAKNGGGKAGREVPERIPDGKKHYYCASLAGTLRRRGFSADEIYASLVAVSHRFESSVPEENLRRIADDIAGRYPAGEKVTTAAKAEPTVGAPNLNVFMHNDHGNSQRLVAMYGADLRYCYRMRKWLVWDGRRWAVDEGDRAKRCAKETALEFLCQAERKDHKLAAEFARRTLDDKRIASMLSSAQCELPINPAELDTHPHLLNFANGTVDLRDGKLLPHEREHFITKIVHHEYHPGAPCPTFIGFLDRIMGGGPDASEGELERSDRLISYLQKALGYSLTGLTSEKAVFFAHGGGNNGKTTLLSVFREILEDYATLLQIDTLMVRQESNNTQADLANLRGARFAMTSETEEGQRLSEGKLKRITQGMGKISATRKYENSIEFAETHKLWMDCNHKPVIRGTDRAIWNRLHLIPFNVVIPDEDIDRSLKGKLMGEATGILSWAVAGGVRWFAEGLGRPPEVAEAVREYRREMDIVGRFIEERCRVLPTAKERSSTLYKEYVRWAEDSGERPVSGVKFGLAMAEREFDKERDERGQWYRGLTLVGKEVL